MSNERGKNRAESDPLQELEQLRERIDEVDKQILQSLAKRFELVSKIGKLKHRYDLKVYDPERAQEVENKWSSYAEQSGFSPECAIKIYKTIHDCSVKAQKSIQD